MPEFMIERAMMKIRPKVASEITGIVSKTGAKTEGIFVGCAMTPHMFNTMPLEYSYDLITQCTEVARAEGCEVIGLGAFTAVVGDAGITVAERSKIAVTTGNSYTVATAIEGTLKACHLVGINTQDSVLAVIGATGSIGKTCARVLAPDFARTIVIGRDPERTQAICDELPRATASTHVEDIKQADVIVTVTSSDAAIVEPQHLKLGAIICDVSRPRDVSKKVVQERPDVLVIEGGVVKVPGKPVFNFDFGFPDGTAYACMCETMMLALENRPESYTLGKDVSIEQVNEMQALADKHGFCLEGFRAFEKAVDQTSIERTRSARLQTIS